LSQHHVFPARTTADAYMRVNSVIAM
jgi:hypothetical protein